MKNKLRSNKGSVTTFVVVTLMVLIVIIMSIYMYNANKHKVNLQVTQNIKSVYEESVTNVDTVYAEMVLKDKKDFANGKWNDVQQVNSPKLLTGMTAVYWSTDGGKTASTTQEGAEEIYSTIDENENPSSTGTANPNFNWDNWYNYVAGNNTTDTRDSRWANAVTDDGSYWVWIPRFKYVISNEPTTAGDTNAGTVDVIFVKTEAQSAATVDGSTYTTTKESFTVDTTTTYEYITRDQNGYILHPAFEDGSVTSIKAQGQAEYVAFNNGEWDEELPGFWVAKYEMSMENANGEHIETTETNGNVPLSSTVKMVSKPGVTSWDYISVENMYTNCREYASIKNSHMMKNSEWGAVAYLTHSQYGRNGNEITNNNSSTGVTGNAANNISDSVNTGGVTNAYNTTAGMLASTTGNIYGVYDMSGGAFEYVACYNNKGTSLTNGSSYASINGTSTKYATAYSNTTNTGSGEMVNNVCRIGDGSKETWVSDGIGWFNDAIIFISSNSQFVHRGGGHSSGVNSGVFRTSRNTGDAIVNHSFRAVLCD